MHFDRSDPYPHYSRARETPAAAAAGGTARGAHRRRRRPPAGAGAAEPRGQDARVPSHQLDAVIVRERGDEFPGPRGDERCEGPGLIPAAVEEAARYDTAIQGFRRVTTRPVTLAGTGLPEGAEVFVAFGAAGRDPGAHECPDEFDITRKPARHLAFGHGVHACPGAQLAREQVRVTLETLTRELPGLRLEGPVEMQPNLIHRSPKELVLTW